MAEQINLVGNFTDNITPKLRKLDRELKNITKAFAKLGGKIRPVTKEMGKLAMASERVSNSMKAQRQDITSTTQAMRAYTTASRKAASQQKKLKPARMPRVPKAPKATGGRGGGMGGAFAAGGSVALGGVGMQLSSMMTQAIVRGFGLGTSILQKSFGFLSWAIRDGISDEMSDIQSAGGMFALDKKSSPDKRLFKNFTQARNMQESLNRELAKSAASLPGATSDYVSASKQLTDTVFALYTKDENAFAALAKSQGGKDGAGAEDQITTVLKKFTEQSVLLSQGGGKGGMPLGLLLEQLVTMENVSIDSMKRRYAQLKKNPLLANALKDAEGAINDAGAGTSQRMKAVFDALEAALPAEVVNSMRRSVDGVIEATRSAFLDQEVGLLGLRRPLESSVAAIDEYGRYVDEAGNVVKTAALAAKEQTTVFKLLRDVIAGFGLPLSEIAGILPQVFDPLEGLASGLFKMRQKAVDFAQMFDRYSNFFNDKKLSDAGARAGLAAFTNLIADLGGLSELERVANIEGLMSGKVDFKTLVPRIMNQVLNSPLAEDFGEMIGSILGETVAMIAAMMTGVLDTAEASGITKGFQKAWKAAGGTKALQTIFSTVFEKMGQALMLAVTTFPKESLIGGALALGPLLLPIIPSVISTILGSLSTAGFGASIAGGFAAILASPALLAAIIAGLAITAKATEGTRKALLGTGTDGGLAGAAQARTNAVRGGDGRLRSLQGNGLAGIMDGLMGELTWVLHDFVKGFGDIFTGLYNIVVGLFTDPALLGEGIRQIFTGLFSLFTMIGHLIIAIGYAVPGLIMGVLIAIKNLFLGIGHAIVGAWMNTDWTNKLGNDIQYLFKSIGSAITSAAAAVGDWGMKLASSVGNFFRNLANKIPGVNIAEPQYNGGGAGKMPLSSAIATENRMKPAGSHLVIANSSETVIPANKGYSPYGMGGGGGVNVTNNFTINGGGMDPQALAEQVAAVVMNSVEEASYSEIYTS